MRRLFSTLLVLTAAAVVTMAQTARVQVIHNCADPLAATVDVYVNGAIALNDVAFRTATGFLDLPLSTTVAIAPASSESVAEALFTKAFTLADGETYLLVASGVLTPESFAPNPDPEAQPIAFNLYPVAQARVAGSTETDVDVIVFHGATDAPKVDVLAGAQRLIEGLSFGEASSYLTVPPASYTINIAPSGGDPLLAYTADLSALGGQAITVLASGFLSPGSNQNGAAFGLYAITKDGGAFIPLPPKAVDQTAKIQIIHNAADPLAAAVDLYVDGVLAADNFAFRTATPFVSIPANRDVVVAVAAPSSTSADNPLATFTYNLPVGRYVAIANGVLTPSAFAPNPDPRAASIGFSVFPIMNVRPGSMNPGEVDAIIFHGATDAPAVDVYANGQLKLVSDLVYGIATPYISVPALSYTINVAPAGGTPIANFRADLSGLAGQSIIVVASGFLDPSANNNGPAFGLYAALSDGGPLVQLPPTTSSVDEQGTGSSIVVSPNPVTAGEAISIRNEQGFVGEVTMTSMLGNVVFSGSDVQLIPTDGLSRGIYVVSVTIGGQTVSAPITIVK
jgi:hypothetical protein